MIPKHDNPTRTRRDGSWAYAPYNFVPLPEKVVLVDSIPAQDRYTFNTGYIECSLTTESPLYTRCGMKDLYLFSWDDVPGSDSEKVRSVLKDICDISWSEKAEINKHVDGKIIRISRENDFAEIMINEKEEKATLAISNGRRYDLNLKKENGKLKIYLNFFSEFGEMSFDKLPEKIKKERAQFFHLSENPLIPGSSLRGMVRTLVEIAGYGKVQWVTDKKLVYRGVGGGGSLGTYYGSKLLGPQQRKAGKLWFDYPSRKVRGGYLEKKNGQCYIRPAKNDLNNETFVHVEEKAVNCGTHDPKKKYTNTDDLIDVYLRPPAGRIERSKRLTLHLAVVEDKADIVKINSKTIKPTGFEKAVVVRSGHLHGKHMHCAIYEPNGEADLIQIPNPMWSLYKEDRDMTRGIETRPLENNGDPLFYLVDDQDQLVFFGPTMMFRLPYDETVNHFVPKDIREPGGIDLAEAIFGYIDKGTDKTARAGRVFFTDAEYKSAHNGIWATEEPIKPQILSSPKPTSFQHYLVQDSEKDHNPDDKNSLAHYATPSLDETVIRGCKMYWHKNDIPLEDIKANPADVDKYKTQYTSIKPVNTGVTFSFRVYFENLRKYELGALLWVLKLPDDKEYRHKIGMGKPLGMGAVKIEPELHLSDHIKRYERLFDGNNWAEGVSSDDPKPFIRRFEDHVLDSLRRGDNDLKDVERIKMLLKMLEWPGPEPEMTKYLKSMPKNEYKERPVLPTPLKISPPP